MDNGNNGNTDNVQLPEVEIVALTLLHFHLQDVVDETLGMAALRVFNEPEYKDLDVFLAQDPHTLRGRYAPTRYEYEASSDSAPRRIFMRAMAHQVCMLAGAVCVFRMNGRKDSEEPSVLARDVEGEGTIAVSTSLAAQICEFHIGALNAYLALHEKEG